MIPSRATLTGPSTTSGFIVYYPDINRAPFSVAVSASPASSGNAGFSIEHSFDYLGMSSAFISSNATWYVSSGVAAASSNSYTAYTYPVTAIRLNSTISGGISSASQVIVTFVQAG